MPGSRPTRAGDDLAEVTGTAVRFRLGVGANADHGGVALPEAGGSLRFRVLINKGVPENTVISNQATLFGDPTDPVASNDKATVTLTATPTADLALTKTVNQPTADALVSTVAFTVTVENRGPWPATGVIVDDVLPSAFFPPPEFAGSPAPTSTPSRGTYDTATGRWVVGTLDATERATLVIVTQVYGPGTTTNTAQARSTEPDDPNLTTQWQSATSSCNNSRTMKPLAITPSLYNAHV